VYLTHCLFFFVYICPVALPIVHAFLFVHVRSFSRATSPSCLPLLFPLYHSCQVSVEVNGLPISGSPFPVFFSAPIDPAVLAQQEEEARAAAAAAAAPQQGKARISSVCVCVLRLYV